MAYQALYRVWRPQKFSDMVGQEIITKTLKNAIITGQTSHAYLFTGPRGTGKTSAAKIFAKALNCLNLHDGEPCNECINCQAINNGSLNDVIEIDAASNNGVEEIRDIRDKVKYAPTQAPFKVYIIDEVHMLSTGAFNALLKTLEEPPAQVVFILATTEPHKIPLTIISRTQRFDFRRIGTTASIARMEYILEQKGYQYEASALKVIANAAEGGMRDALSILDQTLSFGDDKVTLANALLVTGAVKQSLLNEYVTAVLAEDVPTSLQVLESILQEGKDAHRFIEDLISYIRDLLLANQAPDMVTVTPDEVFTALSKQVTPDYAYAVINVLNDVQQQLRFTTHPDVYLEVLTVKLASLKTITSQPMQPAVQQPSVAKPQSQSGAVPTTPAARPTIAREPVVTTHVPRETLMVKAEMPASLPAEPSLLAEPKQAEVMPVEGARNIPVSGPAGPVVNTATTGKMAFDGQTVFTILQAATKGALRAIEDNYPDLLNMLSVVEMAKLNQAKPVAASPNGIVLAFSQPYIHRLAQQDANLQHNILQSLNRLTGETLTVALITDDQWVQLRNSYISQYKEKIAVNEMTVPQLAELAVETQPPVEGPVTVAVTPTAVEPVIEEPALIAQAKDLFGDIVTVEND
ncbi:DNA polymerase III subunit gamma/tau [Periweissella ghanensis]|uniref:DNA-directed DNA polymerase n=1 Tax=Periweissella ghanensis TaxID=467997 RepID=A0ABM8ZBQ5_9LACO|nr:DNA polymerase III subunit gamma/tau [Periweissella ghanensis]MCM0601628.1 DNA polymerase III subunit gamma/tau [Periweissella ghanensis]CAH0418707.1 hypothetical protein WGH24286_01138 [Periweissella ghanensis]